MKEWNTGLMAHLGMRFVEVGPDRVVAELDVRSELATVGGALHGGTLMALADTVGAAGTAAMVLRTATLESKTNFFAAALQGKVRAESMALHKGKRTHVWQTRVTDESGRLLSLTIQTQMIL
jgi:uncharacterized protein (TIGR00369 family)